MGCQTSSEASKIDRDTEDTETQNVQDQGTPSTAEDQAAEQTKIKAAGRQRRAGVAAESVSNDDLKNYKKPVHPKDEAQKQRLLKTLKEHDKMQVLLGHLDAAKMEDLVNAFYLKEVPSGVDIIKQGADGDCLYIVDDGTVDIFVARGTTTPGDKGTKVLSIGAGALFGELALMYNAPRAATVCCTSPVKAFALDAMDFKMLLASAGAAQYARYEGWLQEVELLKTLNHYELASLADILDSECFDGGEDIIKQGEAGDKFYILEDGIATAYISGQGGEKEVKRYEAKGEYFGEIALLTNAPRKATIRAMGEGCNVVSLSKEDFTNMLGPISEILKKHADKYPQYADFMR